MKDEKPVQQEKTVTSVPNPALLLSGVHSDFLKSRINLQEIAATLYKTLGGLVFNRKTLLFERVGDPLCSDQLLEKIVGIVQSCVNHNTIHGNIDAQEAHDIVYDVCEELVILLAFDGRRLGMKSENFGLIVRAVEIPVFLTLSRAIGDGERSHEDETFKSHQTTDNRVFSGGKV